jgi:hypothetical protein
MYQSTRLRRRRLLSILSAVLLLGTTAPSYSLDPKVAEELRYQLNCARLIFRDPVRHAAECNPQFQSGGSGSNNRPTYDPPEIDPPSPPPPPDDGCPPGQLPDGCGGCYDPGSYAT